MLPGGPRPRQQGKIEPSSCSSDQSMLGGFQAQFRQPPGQRISSPAAFLCLPAPPETPANSPTDSPPPFTSLVARIVASPVGCGWAQVRLCENTEKKHGLGRSSRRSAIFSGLCCASLAG